MWAIKGVEMRNVLESTTTIDHYPAVIDRYFKHRHSIHKGPFHIYIYILFHFTDKARQMATVGLWSSCVASTCQGLFSCQRAAFFTGSLPVCHSGKRPFLGGHAFRSCWYNTLFANYVNSRFRVTKTKTPQPMLHEDDLFFIARTSWSHYPIKNCLKVSTGNIWTQLHKVQVWTNDRLQMDFPLQLEYYRPKKTDRNKMLPSASAKTSLRFWTPLRLAQMIWDPKLLAQCNRQPRDLALGSSHIWRCQDPR